MPDETTLEPVTDPIPEPAPYPDHLAQLATAQAAAEEDLRSARAEAETARTEADTARSAQAAAEAKVLAAENEAAKQKEESAVISIGDAQYLRSIIYDLMHESGSTAIRHSMGAPGLKILNAALGTQ